MDSHPRLRKIHQFIKSQTAGKKVETNPKEICEHLARVSAPGPTFYYILDFARFDYEFVSESVREVLKIPPEEYRLSWRWKWIHPEDKEYYVNCVETVTEFMFEKISPTDRPYYKASFQYRLKVGAEYRMFLHQEAPLSFDLGGLLNKNLGSLSDITHITRHNSRRLSMIGLEGRPSYFRIESAQDIPDNQQEGHQYSDRELQVLRLLAEGFSNEKIGEHLNISRDTVRTHRKNILAKSSATNSVQAVASAIRKGLI